MGPGICNRKNSVEARRGRQTSSHIHQAPHACTCTESHPTGAHGTPSMWWQHDHCNTAKTVFRPSQPGSRIRAHTLIFLHHQVTHIIPEPWALESTQSDTGSTHTPHHQTRSPFIAFDVIRLRSEKKWASKPRPSERPRPARPPARAVTAESGFGNYVEC